jgi:hypothetical protein
MPCFYVASPLFCSGGLKAQSEEDKKKNVNGISALRKLVAELRKSDDLALRIVSDIGKFTVALFSVSVSQQGDVLQLTGTGTLVEYKGKYFILTAAHVWEKLEQAARVGITLVQKKDHKFLIDTKTITAYSPRKPKSGMDEARILLSCASHLN